MKLLNFVSRSSLIESGLQHLSIAKGGVKEDVVIMGFFIAWPQAKIHILKGLQLYIDTGY